jgi:DNA-binding transcriptional ArsR family regulator
MASQKDDCGCKVGRVSSKYEVPMVDSRLVDEWKDGTSVRQLAKDLNEDIIESELKATNVGNVGWSRSPVYEALRTEELSEAEAIEIRRELERAGVNVEQLSSDLVSHQTVYRHLTDCLNASKDDERTPEERRKKARDTVYALQQRTEVVTESTIETLQSAGVTDFGEVDVLVDLQVVCDVCDRSVDFETAIEEGCDCSAD